MSQMGHEKRSTKGEDYQFVPRPVAVLTDEYPSGTVDPPHMHERCQLIFATSGIINVITREASYVVPPQRALWIPAQVKHEAVTRTAVSLKTLYVAEGARPNLPSKCRVIEVSSLLRELIVEAARLPIEYDIQGRDGRIMDLILDEITSLHPAPLHVPMPQHAGLIRACRAILDDPAQSDTLDTWADMAGMSRRSFTRLFRKETEMSFADWRLHVRLMEALSRLATGHRITTIALDVGYNSPSAFTAMFRRAFGAAPSHYFDEREPPGDGD